MFSSLRSVTKVFQQTAQPAGSRGFFQKFLYPSDRQVRVNKLHSAGIYPGNPEFDKFYDELTPSKLSQETGVPDALLDDPLLHISVIKYNKHVVEKYNLTPEQEKDLFENFEVSAGDSSFEYHLPLPVPEHNFEELPIIKVYDEEAKH
ncbi:cytochrome c oxidase subunit IV [Heterostelium album PN500]|uniref:Cytochrome c oxidase subunit IV n=1 Tax=Heterostelium pallidum (strain ATCC 26659 / Pp 5 / PN500) TaxID=670386 RepID=D3BGB1_HETP5|nr:cytochrome c oxidase subunit IV [Heterostelium album PN500]EFA79511.1 cytochrome c oxidase subunit IV [Heterostelium album PN500]|eukprot:XP_020431632.1 cytochrome c oxidase subunit IV [Heterostelium album PN500]